MQCIVSFRNILCYNSALLNCNASSYTKNYGLSALFNNGNLFSK